MRAAPKAFGVGSGFEPRSTQFNYGLGLYLEDRNGITSVRQKTWRVKSMNIVVDAIPQRADLEANWN
jgi:hypothetical protein